MQLQVQAVHLYSICADSYYLIEIINNYNNDNVMII